MRAPLVRRLWHVMVAELYTFLFLEIYRSYISFAWGYLGFAYRPMETWELAFVSVSVAIVAFAMPLRIERPSSLVLWLMFVFVFVPTQCLTPIIGERGAEFYIESLLALTAVMLVACIVSQRKLPETMVGSSGLPGPAFDLWLTIAFLVATLILFVMYRSIISFASIDDIYTQRFAAADIAAAGGIGYVRTYYTTVVCSTLIALGLMVPGRKALAVLGAAGFVFTYMIDAQKMSLLTPVIVIALWVMLRRRWNTAVLFTGGLAALTAFTALLVNQTAVVRYFADLVLLRSIAVPGQTFAFYYDLFSAGGYTWWSNITGLGRVIPAPPAFANNPAWPVLGQIVGDAYFGPLIRLNANANLFAGEGVAAAGALGVLVIGLAWVVWLRLFDICSLGWNRTFVLLVTAPLGLLLTNTHLSTLLISFGGLFWLLILHYYKPPARRDAI